ncbi:MAG: prenyltransferase [Methanophagales archaeon ANME-1-THS]|nr:MAG: prenyltransferase [Methanophagales archaeon ANME-1-THS]
MKKLKAIGELTRLEHGVMYGFGVIIGIIVAGGDFYARVPIFGVSLVVPSRIALLGFFVALFIQAGAFALNDYCDLESDTVNRRMDRPLVRGELKKEEALLIAILATALGICSASFLNPLLFSLALLSAALGILYDLKLKEFLAVSNVYIALTMAIPFIFGGLIVDPRGLNVALVILASIAFLAGLGREVMKDIADMNGDALRNVRSVARVYGAESAKRVVVSSYALAVILSFLPFFAATTPYFLNPVYLLPVIAADLLFLRTCVELKPFRKRVAHEGDIDYHGMRKETLIAIGIGLVAFISGALYRF